MSRGYEQVMSPLVYTRLEIETLQTLATRYPRDAGDLRGLRAREEVVARVNQQVAIPVPSQSRYNLRMLK